MGSWGRLRCYPWGSLVHLSIILGLVTVSTLSGCSWLRGVVLFLEDLLFSKVAPTKKCRPMIVGVVGLIGVGCVCGGR